MLLLAGEQKSLPCKPQVFYARQTLESLQTPKTCLALRLQEVTVLIADMPMDSYLLWKAGNMICTCVVHLCPLFVLTGPVLRQPVPLVT